MNRYRVIAITGAALSAGMTVRLFDADLIARNAESLKPTGKGKTANFEVRRSFTLKRGAEFATADDLPKGMIEAVEDPDLAAERAEAAEAAKAAADKAAADKAAADKAAADQGGSQDPAQDPTKLV